MEIRRTPPIQNQPSTTPLRAAENELLVPVTTDAVDLQSGSPAGMVAPRPTYVPLSLARALVQVPQLGIGCAALGPIGASLSKIVVPHTLTPQTVRLSRHEAANDAVNLIVQHDPHMADVKMALFSLLRDKQPAMSPAEIHAANNFIDSSRTPQEMGLRLLGLVRLYTPTNRPSAEQLDAMTEFVQDARGNEAAAVRLHSLPSFFRADHKFSPEKFSALNTYLAEGQGHEDNRLDLLGRAHGASRGQMSPAGIESFGAAVFDPENGDAAIRVKAGMQMAAQGLLG